MTLVSVGETLARGVLMQAESASQTTRHFATPRERAQVSINEIKAMADAAGVLVTTMRDASKQLQRQAEQTSEVTRAAADKVTASVKRVYENIDVDRLVTVARAADLLAASLERLATLEEAGRLAAIGAALRGVPHE